MFSGRWNLHNRRVKKLKSVNNCGKLIYNKHTRIIIDQN